MTAETIVGLYGGAEAFWKAFCEDWIGLPPEVVAGDEMGADLKAKLHEDDENDFRDNEFQNRLREIME